MPHCGPFQPDTSRDSVVVRNYHCASFITCWGPAVQHWFLLVPLCSHRPVAGLQVHKYGTWDLVLAWFPTPAAQPCVGVSEVSQRQSLTQRLPQLFTGTTETEKCLGHGPVHRTMVTGRCHEQGHGYLYPLMKSVSPCFPDTGSAWPPWSPRAPACQGGKGAWWQHCGSLTWVAFDGPGELGTKSSLEANSPILSSHATWLNRSTQAGLCRLWAEAKQNTQQAGKLGPFFFFYPSFVFKQHFQEEERLEESTDLLWGGGLSPRSAVQLRGISPVFLKMYTTGGFAKGWRERATGAGKAEIGRIPCGREKLLSLCNLAG